MRELPYFRIACTARMPLVTGASTAWNFLWNAMLSFSPSQHRAFTWAACWTWSALERGLSHTRKKILPHYCRANSMLIACGIVSYDDLLLPGYRWLAQLPVFTSGEHFKWTKFPAPQYCSFPYKNRKMSDGITVGKYTVSQYGRPPLCDARANYIFKMFS